MVLDGVLVFQFSMIFNVYYTVLLYYCLSFAYPTCRGYYGSDVKSSVAAAFRVHKQSAVWCICTYRTLTRTQDARLQHPIRARKPKKKSASEIDTLGLKCKVPGDPGQMQTDLQSQVFESGMPTMARHPKSLAKRKGKGEEFQKKTSAMMGIPVLKIQHAHIYDLKKFMIKPSGLHNFWTLKE